MIVCASTVTFPIHASPSLQWLTRDAVGIDDLLSKHVSHLFIRDPIVIFSELLDQDDSESTDHFEVRSRLAIFAFIRPRINALMDRTSNRLIGKH